MESQLQTQESGANQGMTINSDNNNNNNGGIGGVQVNGDGGGILNEVLYVKVMTDEQLEILRTQIAVYATICEQLVEMHKAFTSQQDLAGVRLGNLYCDPLVSAVGHKITVRQRWTPTPVQLQTLEQIFKQGTGTPSKQKIKEITAELSQHGQISETNVYNWFQNRRARSKKKQQKNAQSNPESEVETDAESPKDKTTKPENFQFQMNSVSNVHSLDSKYGKSESVIASDGGQENSLSFGMNQLSFYETVLQNTRMDQLIGKMEFPESYNGYQPTEDYSMTG